MTHKQSGLSLVELMIAIALGLILMLGVMQLFLSSRVVFSTQQGLSRIQETGRLAIEFLSRDIRMASYYGCHRPKEDIKGKELRNAKSSIKGLHGNFAEAVRGYDSVDDLPNGKETDLGADIKFIEGDGDDLIANILVVKTANEVGFPITGVNMAASTFTVYNPEPLVDGCADDTCPGSVIVVNDCFKAQVMTIAAIGAPNAAGESVITVSVPPAVPPAVPDPLAEFNAGEVYPVNTVVYFLAEGVGGIPSLWQKTNADTPLELLQGVEQMRLTYATSADPEFRLASVLNDTDWPLVTAVRMELLLRSLENNAVSETQSYVFGGEEKTPPELGGGVADRFMRQVFTSTVGVRSRAVLH